MQSVINPFTADDIYFPSPSGNRPQSRWRNGARGAHPADISLYGWFEAHSDLASKIGFVACVLFYGLTVAYGIVAGGHSHQVHQSIASATSDLAIWAGFEVKAVQVEGRNNVKESEIAAALGPYDGLSIFAFDTEQARKRLKRIGWISEARIMRLLPSTLAVELEENKPFALWREGGKMAAIDAEGNMLGLASQTEFPGLRVVSGAGAAAPAKDVIDALYVLPDLSTRVQDIVRIAGRRCPVATTPTITASPRRDR